VEVLGTFPVDCCPDEIARALDRQEVIRALSDIPTRQRQVVVLRDWAGFGTADVARALGMRESTVRVHLARGRAALRAALGIQEGVQHE